jgi:chromosome segregation ATPase
MNVDYMQNKRSSSRREGIDAVADLPDYAQGSESDEGDDDHIPPFMRTGGSLKLGSPISAPASRADEPPSPSRTFDLSFARTASSPVQIPGADADDPDFRRQMREEAPRSDRRAPAKRKKSAPAGRGMPLPRGPDAPNSRPPSGTGPPGRPDEPRPGAPPSSFSGDFQWDEAVMGQAQAVQARNQQLSLEAMEKDQRIKRLETLLEAIEPVPGVDPRRLMECMTPADEEAAEGRDPRDVKIVQLAKKVRNLKVKAQAGQNRLRKATQRLEECEAELAEHAESAREAAALAERLSGGTSADPSAAGDADGGDAAGEAGAQLAAARAELRETQRQRDKLRVKVNRQQQLTRKYYQALQREVGDAEELKRALGEPNSAGASSAGASTTPQPGWRGRAQSIVVLRQQNKQLRQQLKQLQNLDYRSSRDAKDVDLRNRADLRAMEEARRAAAERLGEELHDERQKSTKLEAQLKAARARSSALSTENKKARTSIKTLLSKTRNDDELLDAVRGELEDARERLRDAARGAERAELAERAAAESDRLRARVRALTERVEAERRAAAEARARAEDAEEAAEAERSRRNERMGQNEAARRTLARADADRLTELLELERGRAREREKRAEEAEARCAALEAEARRTKRRLDRARADAKRLGSGTYGGKRAEGLGEPSPRALRGRERQKRVEDLEDELRDARDARASMKRDFQRMVRDKEEEIRILREMGEEMRLQLNEAVDGRSTGHRDARSRDGRGDGRGDAQRVRALQKDNAHLRRELEDLQKRYRTLAARAGVGHR